MTDEQFETIMTALRSLYALQQTQTRHLEAIANHLATLTQAQAGAAPAPNLQRRLAEFADFDWSSIAATVVDSDDWGAALVEWQGRQFKRRSPDNKFDAAIWYSRAVGKEGDKVRYERLITFKKIDADTAPISRSAERALAEPMP